jgi:hypothetical protein
MDYLYDIIDDASKTNIATLTRKAPIPHLSTGDSFSLQKGEEFVPYTVISVHSLVSLDETSTQRVSVSVGPQQIRAI